MARERPLRAAEINRLRMRIVEPFFIRGTTRRHTLATRAAFKAETDFMGTSGTHAYRIDPLEGGSNAEAWLERLESTLHAAVARGIMQGNLERPGGAFDSNVFSGGKIDPKMLPVIMAFGFEDASLHEKRTSAKRSFLGTRNMHLALGGKPRFREGYMQLHEHYERAAVRGEVKPTFHESVLGHTIDNDGMLRIKSPKLFEARMTVSEFRDVVNRVNRKLKAGGLPALHEIGQEDEEVRKKALPLLVKNLPIGEDGKPMMRWNTPETTPYDVPTYLFYLEAAPFLAKKFARTGLRWLDKTLPKGA